MTTNTRAQVLESRLLEDEDLEFVAGGFTVPDQSPKTATISGPCSLWDPAAQWIACFNDSCGCPKH